MQCSTQSSSFCESIGPSVAWISCDTLRSTCTTAESLAARKVSSVHMLRRTGWCAISERNRNYRHSARTERNKRRLMIRLHTYRSVLSNKACCQVAILCRGEKQEQKRTEERRRRRRRREGRKGGEAEEGKRREQKRESEEEE